MATFNRSFRPYQLPDQASFNPSALGDPSDSTYDDFLAEAESLFGTGRAGQEGGWQPNNTDYGTLGDEDRVRAQQENARLGFIYDRAKSLGIGGLPAVQQIMQQRAEMKARGGYSPPPIPTSGGVSQDAQRFITPMNAPARINDYNAPTPNKRRIGPPGGTGSLSLPSRMGKAGQPFGQQAYGTGFSGPSTGFGGFGNPSGRSRYDKQR